jgi:hypothetical protein
MSNMVISINHGQHHFLFNQATGILVHKDHKYRLINSIDWDYRQIRNALRHHVIPLINHSSPIADMLFNQLQAVEVLNV